MSSRDRWITVTNYDIRKTRLHVWQDIVVVQIKARVPFQCPMIEEDSENHLKIILLFYFIFLPCHAFSSEQGIEDVDTFMHKFIEWPNACIFLITCNYELHNPIKFGKWNKCTKYFNPIIFPWNYQEKKNSLIILEEIV